MKIVKEKKWVTHVSFSLSFRSLTELGTGWGFDCDENGQVDESAMPQPMLENYRKCVAGDGAGKPQIIRYERGFMSHAVGQCNCGALVTLAHFTNTCSGCGTDYNFAGQTLARRSQWGCETGEAWHECY